ncbi:MAG: DUF1328 domain-containing protein [Alphaproteobacteria bacterium]|nr:DUF1328 domain-containing protein [Alphaproteobacteria bacterium]
MLRIAIAFFVFAIVAGVLGFGGFAGAFSAIAVVAFYAFLALLIFALLASLFTGRMRGAGGTFGALVVAGLIGAGVYAWVDNDMSAERLGRSIDRTVADAADAVGESADTAGSETQAFLDRVDDAADEAADGDGQ